MGDGRQAVVAADDVEFHRALRKEAAELAGSLFEVGNGRDCLRAIEDKGIRLVVLDSSLRDVSGTHLVHLVRRIRPDLGVIVAFDRSDCTQEREARQAGILYYGDRRGVREIAAFLRKCLAAGNGNGTTCAPGAANGGAHDGSASPEVSGRGDAADAAGDTDPADHADAAGDAAGQDRV